MVSRVLIAFAYFLNLDIFGVDSCLYCQILVCHCQAKNLVCERLANFYIDFMNFFVHYLQEDAYSGLLREIPFVLFDQFTFALLNFAFKFYHFVGS